jgi:hypothetical protein
LAEASSEDALRDGTAMTLAWYRSDQANFERIVASYRGREHLLVGAAGTVVYRITVAMDDQPAEQERIIRALAKGVRSQLQGLG